MNISIVVPAKGTSKRVANKNLYQINGKSLVYRACEKILECKNINNSYLDTEDKGIKLDCKPLSRKGLKFIDRPQELATNFIGANELFSFY